MNRDSLDSVHLPLRVAFGLMPLLAGLDKFLGLLTDWKSYLSPWVRDMLPFSAETFMMLVGVVEIAVGLAILTRFTRLGAYLAMGWLVLISINLVIAGVLDVAVRDLVLAVAAYSLGRLSELKGLEWLPGLHRDPAKLRAHAPSNS